MALEHLHKSHSALGAALDRLEAENDNKRPRSETLPAIRPKGGFSLRAMTPIRPTSKNWAGDITSGYYSLRDRAAISA